MRKTRDTGFGFSDLLLTPIQIIKTSDIDFGSFTYCSWCEIGTVALVQ
jgi:hypothetical protein